MKHFYGDNCPNGHFIEGTPDTVKVVLAGAPFRGVTAQAKIDVLVQTALDFHDKAMAYEQKANARLERIKETLIEVHYRRARAGNPLSRRIMADPDSLQVYAEAQASTDPKWQAYVANNQFYTRKAGLANSMAQTLIAQQHMTGGM